MTTNPDLDQAREVADTIAQSPKAYDSGMQAVARVIASLPDEWIDADKLAAEGLIAPDLPEPQTFPNGEKEWYTLSGWVNLDPDGTITVVYDERDEDDIAAGAEIEPGELVFTRLSEVRVLADALKAAAEHAEEAGHAQDD